MAEIDWSNTDDPEIKSAINRIKIYQLRLLDRMALSVDELISALHDTYNQAIADGFPKNDPAMVMQGATYLLMYNLEYADSHSSGITSKSASVFRSVKVIRVQVIHSGTKCTSIY